jgi:hypothetical protein
MKWFRKVEPHRTNIPSSDCSAAQAELIIKTNLTAEEKAKYLKPGYRIRIIK